MPDPKHPHLPSDYAVMTPSSDDLRPDLIILAGDALAEHLRIRALAPSGTRICTCRVSGLYPRCWYCVALELRFAWEKAIGGRRPRSDDLPEETP